jgi:hypothetical protein
MRRDRKVLRFPAAILSHSSARKAKQKSMREDAMAKSGLGTLPTQNPCAQCGKPIAFPDWIEVSPGCTAYLWHCRACDYRFEAIAYFEESATEPAPLAA